MTAPRVPGSPSSAGAALPPDPAAEPAGYVVLVPPQERIHFLDWTAAPPGIGDGVLLVHGLAATAEVWAPVARRLCRIRPVVAMDLRGHGLSDAPTEGYDLPTLGSDVVAVAEGSGLLDAPGARVILAGHGFGAIVAAHAAIQLAERCAALVLVDGGWEDLGVTTGQDADEFLRTLEEPPEVLRSLATYLADREGFDPTTWDADQQAAARAAVIELPAGRVVSATRPHALEACVRAMFTYSPSTTLRDVTAPIRIVSAADDEAGGRSEALRRTAADLAAARRPRLWHRSFPSDGHNLMRYRSAEVASAILGAVDEWPRDGSHGNGSPGDATPSAHEG